MKKLILGIIIVLATASCEESSLDKQALNSESRVPVSFSDSTKWETVKYYQVNKDEAYLRKKETVVKVHSDDSAKGYIACLFVGVLFGFLFGVAVFN